VLTSNYLHYVTHSSVTLSQTYVGIICIKKYTNVNKKYWKITLRKLQKDTVRVGDDFVLVN